MSSRRCASALGSIPLLLALSACSGDTSRESVSATVSGADRVMAEMMGTNGSAGGAARGVATGTQGVDMPQPPEVVVNNDGTTTLLGAPPDGEGGGPSTGTESEGHVVSLPAMLPDPVGVDAGAGVSDWPDELPPELQDCELTGREKPASDQCFVAFECDGVGIVEVDCDGENDGTDTSLCDCDRNGDKVDAVSAPLYPTESFPACIAAAARCVTAP